MSLRSPASRKAVGGNHLPPADVLFGSSRAMAAVRQRAEKICFTNIQVLICGDGGTGKELLARWIHANSAHAAGQFVSVNCAAIPRTLLESELFGYEKGAFTGARNTKPGRVEFAEGGTLLLDEIGEMEPEIQSKLLSFLQDGKFSRIGDVEERTVNARLICASSKNLEEQVEKRLFRADLYHRINVVQLYLPALRERREDIPSLAEYFRVHYARQFGREASPLGHPILEYLRNRDWPGNIRELANCIARHVLVGPEATIEAPPPDLRRRDAISAPTRVGSVPLKHIATEAVRELERNIILDALRANRWNRRRTAQELKISYRTLIYKIRDAGLAHRRPRTSGLPDIASKVRPEAAPHEDEARGTKRE